MCGAAFGATGQGGATSVRAGNQVPASPDRLLRTAMTALRKWRPLVIVACVLAALGLGSLAVPRLLPTASAATKTLYIPPSWATTGGIPWSMDRSAQSNNFILLWGEKSGTT